MCSDDVNTFALTSQLNICYGVAWGGEYHSTSTFKRDKLSRGSASGLDVPQNLTIRSKFIFIIEKEPGKSY